MLDRLLVVGHWVIFILILPCTLLHEATHAVVTYPAGSVPAAGLLMDGDKPAGAWVFCEREPGLWSYVITLSPLIWLPIALLLFHHSTDLTLVGKLWMATLGGAGFGGIGDAMSIFAPSLYEDQFGDYEHITIIGTRP